MRKQFLAGCKSAKHADTPVGKAYVKLTLRADGAPVIQFKELEP